MDVFVWCRLVNFCSMIANSGVVNSFKILIGESFCLWSQSVQGGPISVSFAVLFDFEPFVMNMFVGCGFVNSWVVNSYRDSYRDSYRVIRIESLE